MENFGSRTLLELGLELAKSSLMSHDFAIQSVIRQAAKRLRADRSYLFLIDQATETLSNTHEWCRPGVPPQRERVQSLSLAHFPWLREELYRQNVIHIQDVDDLDESAMAEKAEFKSQRIRSMIMVPLRAQGGVIGFFGFDSVGDLFHLPPTLSAELSQLGVLMSAAVHRYLCHQQSVKLQRSIDSFSTQFPGIVFQFRLYPDGRMRFPYVSSAVASMFGRDPEKLSRDGRPLLNHAVEEDRSRLFSQIQKSAKTLSAFTENVRAMTLGGSEIWIEVRAVPQRLADESILWHGYFHDFTEKKKSSLVIEQQNRRNQAVLDNIADGVITADSQGRIQTFNLAAESIFGYPAHQVIGKDVGMLMPVRVRSRQLALLSELQGKEPSSGRREMVGVTWQGREFPAEVKLSRVLDEDGERFIGIFSDISERKSSEREIERLAFYDSLTGLPNRRLLRDRLSQALASSSRYRTHGALVFIDLDNFKTINDSAGHVQGDNLLRQVAERLTDTVREWDTVARLGGDEFVLILKGFAEDPQRAAEQARKVCEKVRSALIEPYRLGESFYSGTPSCGVTLFFDHEVSLEELLQQADMAMFRAKDDGKNRVRFFDAAMQDAVNSRMSLESDLREAVRTEQFTLHYQLQYDQNSMPYGAEALLRWHSDARGYVSPAEFIPAAEELGLIEPIGEWVLKTACKQLVSWERRGKPFSDLTLSVNVSAKQFHQPDFLDTVISTIRESGVRASRLKLELTESALAFDLQTVEDTLQSLRNVGVKVSLDDFGTGYSSLGYLKRLPLDELKIDQGFVRDILDNGNDAAIAKMIISLAGAMKLAVIAEGVETPGQRDLLATMGCSRYQGYLFARPLPGDHLVRHLMAEC
ncbi:MAG: EAL domain-containing protein [Gammaproteobacteria bacterium]|nr:MAG: EAL domain-containing protein [Gammaproteobacteria bacterium]